MAYQNKTQATDPAFALGQNKNKGDDGSKSLTSAEVLAANENAAKNLQKSIDASPHPYSISAKHDEAELKMRARTHQRK